MLPQGILQALLYFLYCHVISKYLFEELISINWGFFNIEIRGAFCEKVMFMFDNMNYSRTIVVSYLLMNKKNTVAGMSWVHPNHMKKTI